MGLFMKKLLFTFLSLLPFILKAAPGPMPAPQQGSMFGGQGGIDGSDIMIMAYDVRRDLMAKQELNSDLITEIEHIIRQSMEEQNPSILKAYKFLLRRYNRIAHICQRKQFNQLEYLKARADLETRKQLIGQILKLYNTLNTAQHVVQNLDTTLPQPPTHEQRQAYYDSYQKMYDEKIAQIKRIQSQLDEVEVKLLKDPRTFWEKYGGLIVGSTVTISSMVVAGMLGNAVGTWWRNRKNKGAVTTNSNDFHAGDREY